MTPRHHRMRSSKENRIRQYNVSEAAAFLHSGILEIASRGSSTLASFPTSDRSLAYVQPSRHSDGTAIGR